MVVTELKPTIKIERGVSDTKPNLGDTIEFTVTITNEGQKVAQNAVYIDEFPSGLQPIYNELISVVNNNVQWAGSIVDEVKFSYKVKVNKKVDFSSIGTLNYQYNGYQGSKDSSAIKIKASESLGVTSDLEASETELYQKVEYTQNFTNKEENVDMRVDRFVLTLDEPLRLTKDIADLTKISDHEYEWKGTLGPGEGVYFELETYSNMIGTHHINYSIDYTINNVKLNKKGSKELKVKADKLKPTIEFAFGDKELESNQKSNVRTLLENKDEKTVYYDIEYNVETDFIGNFKGSVDKVLASTKERIFEKDFYAPWVDSTVTLHINFNGKYRTSANERFIFNISDEFTVEPKKFNSSIIIEQKVPNELKENEKGTVIIKVRNVKNKMLKKLEVKGIVPEYFKVVGNKKHEIENLAKDFDDIVYYYDIIYKPLEEHYNVTSFNTTIKTEASYVESGETYHVSNSSTFTVKKGITTANESVTPTAGEQVVTAGPSENLSEKLQQRIEEKKAEAGEPVVEVTAQPVEEKKSFWQKIKDFFKNLFS